MSRWSIGTVSFGGYLVATVLSLGVAPVLYIIIKGLEQQFLGGGTDADAEDQSAQKAAGNGIGSVPQ